MIHILLSFCEGRYSSNTRLFQITVYLGKRDFVDHITHVDPIGTVPSLLNVRIFNWGPGYNFKYISQNRAANIFLRLLFPSKYSNGQLDDQYITIFIYERTFPILDGVVLIEPDYVKDRKVFGHVLAAFRYGREDLDVLGLTFRKDLYLAAEQIFPQLESAANKRPLTRLQVIIVYVTLFHTHSSLTTNNK